MDIIGTASNHTPDAAPAGGAADTVGEWPDRRRALGTETRQRILEAAERLFAANSYDAVGMREITRAARVNTAAVHYHFGTKEALLVELLRARAVPIARQRLELLATLRDRGALVLEDVLRAFLEPAFFGKHEGAEELRHSPFAELRARLAFDSEPAVRKVLSEIFDESSREYIEAISKCVPNLPKMDLLFRFHFLLGAMFYTMLNPGRVYELSGGECDPSDREAVMRHAIQFLAAGFRAPSES